MVSLQRRLSHVPIQSGTQRQIGFLKDFRRKALTGERWAVTKHVPQIPPPKTTTKIARLIVHLRKGMLPHAPAIGTRCFAIVKRGRREYFSKHPPM
eukprot:3825158-Amphidinium_carterae.1